MSGHRVAAITRRLMQGFRRDRRTLALLFVAPLVILGLLGYLIRNSQVPSVGIANEDRLFTYRQTLEGLWMCFDDRLGLGAIARSREEAHDQTCAFLREHFEHMTTGEFGAQLSGCAVFYVDEFGREIAEAEDAPAAC